MESRQFSTFFVDYIVFLSCKKKLKQRESLFNSRAITIFVYSLYAGNTTLYW